MRSISVSQLCNRSTNLHLCGYSEEVLDNLIQNGDLQGYFNSGTGELMIDTDCIMDFLPCEFQNRQSVKKNQNEKVSDSKFYEGWL